MKRLVDLKSKCNIVMMELTSKNLKGIVRTLEPHGPFLVEYSKR